MTNFDLTKEIEKEHSKRNTVRIARWAGAAQDHFDHLMRLLLHGDTRTAQRASWIVTCCTEEHPELFIPWIGKAVRRAAENGIHDAVKRNIVRSLQFVDIPKRHQGSVANLCFGFLQSVEIPVAVKAFSMTVLTNIAEEEPDLKREIALLIEEMIPYSSAGIRSRARHTLRLLKK